MELHERIRFLVEEHSAGWCNGCPEADHFFEPEEWICSLGDIDPSSRRCIHHGTWALLAEKVEEIKHIVEEREAV